MKKGRGPKLYGTKQVAEAIRIPEWRVKNFTEGSAYGLPPSQSTGTGRGSRRLYQVRDILRIAVANELVEYGFTPEAVGRAVREIPESKLRAASEDERKYGEIAPLLVCLRGEWEIWTRADVFNFFSSEDQTGVFFLDFQMVIESVLTKMATKTEQAAPTKAERKR